MNRSEQIHIAVAVVEVALPLALGIAHGVLAKKFLQPMMMARLGGLARLVHSPANVILSFVMLGLWLGLAFVCHAANAPETLAWLREHPILPVEPTPTLLRVVYFGATVLTGSSLAGLPSHPTESESIPGGTGAMDLRPPGKF